MEQEKVKKLEEIISKDCPNIAGLIIRQNNQKIYENYWNDCNPESRIHLFSVTKSIISLLIGIALDKGFIQSLDQKILAFFPNYQLKRGEKILPQVCLRDLLTMTVPYKYKGGGPYTQYFTSSDWVKSSLDLIGGRKGKIGDFRYAPLIGPDVLSGILIHATGQSILDFANEQLFEPLDFKVTKNIIFANKTEQMDFYKSKDNDGWVADPNAVNTATWGLSLSAKNMAKIGQLCLNKGKWKGKPLISEQWIEESTSPQSYWQEMKLDYGYLWWIIDPEKQIYSALGDGGNVIYVNSEKKLVIAIASLFKPQVTNRMELIQKQIEPLF